jgi:hypothetical protein
VVSLNGSGALVLDSAAIQGSYNSTLNNASTIEGSGAIGTNIGLALNNTGAIDANQTSALVLEGGYSTTNTGTLEATNGGKLVVDSTLSGTGSLQVGAGSEIELGVATSETATFTGCGERQAEARFAEQLHGDDRRLRPR